MRHNYTVEGTAADGQTYTCAGEVQGDYPNCLHEAMVAAFRQLTGGKAVFGKPGVSCRGPYTIARFELKTITE